MTSYIVAFFTLFILDIAWSFYLNRVKDGAALSSATWAAALYIMGASATIAWTTNHWLLVPAVLGSFAGTYVGVWWNNRNKEKNAKS